MLLIDGAGNAIAYPGSQTLLVDANNSVQLLKASVLSAPLAALLQSNSKDLQHGHVRLNPRDWIISRSHINEGGPQLPNSYAGVVVLALFPPRWRALMDTRGKAYYAGEEQQLSTEQQAP